jgi:mono/diheme cytochrome c family protein
LCNEPFLSLLTDSNAYVNADLAKLYGVQAPVSGFAWVALDPKQRAGILTQAGILAGLAHEREHAPILRGVFVLDNMLCTPPPPPPKDIPAAPAPDAQNPKTTRERLQKQHEVGVCAGCHVAIDGAGFAFENYDAVGGYRTKDNGFDVDASGQYSDRNGNTVKFANALELAGSLGQSKAVQVCFAEKWYSYGLGVARDGVESAQLDQVLKATQGVGLGADLNMRDLAVALVRSEAFRTRIKEGQ